MGNLITDCLDCEILQERRIVMFGLQGSGKTTIMQQLSTGEIYETNPTKGWNIECFKHGKYQISLWDFGGQVDNQYTWLSMLHPAHGIIYVIDCSDRQLINQSIEGISELLFKSQIQAQTPILFFLNKFDKAELSTKQLIVDEIQSCSFAYPYKVQACSALDNQGLKEGLDWLSARI